MFIKGFDKRADEGDRITAEVDGFQVTATLYRDDNHGTPAERCDGFWPSPHPDEAGYVLPENFAAETERAKRVMAAWENDEWFYCGVAVTVARADVQLTGKYENALWGIECNYPDSDNSYLLTVANELLGEALAAAQAKLAELCASMPPG